jgi:probable phosphoglycerate mutase
MLGEKFDIRPKDKPELDEVRLGLWEGLTRDELEHRFETVFPLWLEQPLAVTPPDGESLPEAIQRIDPVVRKLLRRRRGAVMALVLRPLTLQIVAGLLRAEANEAIASHLHSVELMETIELTDEQVEKIVSSQ